MDHDQAREIVRLLTDGIDPTTGEEFPNDSPYQQPSVIRALFVAKLALEAEVVRAERRRRLPENTGRPWSADEDRRMIERFEGGAPIPKIAADHERTVGGIRARLLLLGKIALDPNAKPAP